MTKKPTQARRMSRQLENIRRTFERRAKAFEKASQLTMNMAEGVEYIRAAQALRQEAKAFTMATVRSHQEYLKNQKGAMTTLSAAFSEVQAKAKARLAYVPSQKPKDIIRSEALANVQYKYAAREIMIFTYGSVWKPGDTKEERQRKIRETAARELGVSPETITTQQLMSFYQNIIREYTGDDSYELTTDPFVETVIGAGKYEKDLESGYSIYLGRR